MAAMVDGDGQCSGISIYTMIETEAELEGENDNSVCTIVKVLAFIYMVFNIANMLLLLLSATLFIYIYSCVK